MKTRAFFVFMYYHGCVSLGMQASDLLRWATS